jgi:hypothetical protein
MGHGTEARRAAKAAKEEALTDKLADTFDSFRDDLGCDKIAAEILVVMAKRQAAGHEKLKTALARRRLERYAWKIQEKGDRSK